MSKAPKRFLDWELIDQIPITDPSCPTHGLIVDLPEHRQNSRGIRFIEWALENRLSGKKFRVYENLGSWENALIIRVA